MAVAIAQTANPAGVTAASSITTYSAASVGAAANGRQVLVTIGKEVATVVVSSATIEDDVGIRPMASINGTTFGSMGAWLYGAPVSDSATTVNIAITWSGAITDVQNHIAVYVATDAAAPPSSGTNTSTDMDVTAPLTTGSTVIPTGGGMLAVAVGATDTVAKTWANITEDLDVDAGDFRFTTATSITAGTATRTCTGGTNGEDGAMAWAIFSQQSIPEINMQPYR